MKMVNTVTASTQQVASQRCPAAILFARLRNFTRMSEMFDAQTVLHLVGEFYALTSRIAKSHDGEVIEMHNDSLMATFRAGRPDQDAVQAVGSALELQVEFGGLAESWEHSYGLHIAVGLGLHLGDTVFGVTGPEDEARFVAFGDAVSIAERLVHRARAGEFVMSDAVFTALEGSDLDVEVRPLPALELARRPPIRLYGVLLDTRLDFT